MMRKFWMFWRGSTLTEEDRRLTDLAERDLEMRKKRGQVVHQQAAEIVRRNNLAEKFHTAFTLPKPKKR